MASYVNDPLRPDYPVSQVWYTLSAIEEVQEVESTVPVGEVPINSSSKRVHWENRVYYVVKVYRKVGNSTERLDIPNKWSVEGLTPETVSELSGSITYGDFLSGRNGDYQMLFDTNNEVKVGFRAQTANVMLKPFFRVTLEKNAFGPNLPPQDSEIFPQNEASVPVIYFTEGSTQPAIPQQVKDDTNYGSTLPYTHLDTCVKPSQWVALVQKEKNNKVSVFINRYRLDGVLVNSKFIGTKGDGTKKDYYKIGLAEIVKLKSTNCDSYSGQSDPGGASSEEAAPAISGITFNPPNHPNTRSLGAGERVLDKLLSSGAVVVDPLAIKKGLNARLGKIYQSDSGAKALNTPNKQGKLNFWGFRFHYNPQSLQYGTTTNTSIDWLMYSSDPANLLGGNTTVEVELILNRILDMTALKAGKPVNYGGVQLSTEDVKGILARGTEYDLDFLYRVLVGDPEEKNNLLTYPGKTADIGFITGTPCWFHFHDNMKYFGSMAQINVTHKIFNSNMVPMLSTVKLSFIRYPSYEGLPEEVKKALEDRAKTVVNTAKEPKTK